MKFMWNGGWGRNFMGVEMENVKKIILGQQI